MIEDKTLDFVAHVNGELQDVLRRRACRQALFDAPSLLRLHLRQKAHQLVPLLAWPKGYLRQILGFMPTSQKQEGNMSASCFYESCC